MNEFFRRLAHGTAKIVGSAWTFFVALMLIVVWGVTGPLFHFSDTWQLIINTGTTIVTFLMVFLLQNSQNRDAKAIQIKLDELLRAIQGARTGLVNLEECTEEELSRLQKEFASLRVRSAEAVEAVEDVQEAVENVQEVAAASAEKKSGR